MLILSIDSTSFLPKVALTKNNMQILEVRDTTTKITWDFFRGSDGLYMQKEFDFQLNILLEKTKVSFSEITYICFSGISGFKKTMAQGKIFAEKLASLHNIPVMNIDHITSHCFSSLVGVNIGEIKYPILYFSASGSHNSFSVLKTPKEFRNLYDVTQYDTEEKKYIGLGGIFYRITMYLNFIEPGDILNNLGAILSQFNYEVSEELKQDVKSYYTHKNIYDTSFLEALNLYKTHHIDKKSHDAHILFFSFQEAIFEILLEKIIFVSSEIKPQQIHIVGGISENDTFFKLVSAHFSGPNFDIQVHRPEKEYRFDNATMLGITAYNMKTYEGDYDFSHIVTH